MAEDRLYEVEQILGKKIVNKRRLYLVRWRGFSSEHDSWEPYSNLEACKSLIKLYNQTIQDSKNQQDTILRNGIKPVYTSSNKTTTNSVQENAETIKKAKTSGNNITPTAEIKPAKTVMDKKKAKKNPVLTESKVLQIKEDLSVNSNISSPLTNNVSEVLKKPSTKKKKSVKTNISSVLINNTEPETVKKSSKQKHDEDKTVNSNSSLIQINNNDYEAIKKSAKRMSDEDHSKCKTSKVKKAKNTHTESAVKVDSVRPQEPRNESDDENDDDILYSLNPDCDIVHLSSGKIKKLHIKKHGAKEKQSSLKSKPSVIVKKSSKSVPSKEESLRNVGAKKKSLNLIDSKKKSKDWLSKSVLLRSASPPPLFTAVKHIVVSRDTSDPSIRSSHSLPDPVSPEASETYLADVPSSYPVAAEEPVVNDNISAGSLSYKSLLDSLPEQLHPGHKTNSTAKTESGISECSSSNGGSLFSSTLSSSFGGESVERRTSVRSTECAFRYKQIVVKKCLRYTQIWLNTQTVMHNALNPQVIQEVVSALNSAKYDDSHLVLFSSLGNVFCSGTDLHFLVSGDRKMAARQMTDAIRELTKAFITFPKPILAAVSGAVVGLGVSLLALCDVVYASDKASFHLPYSQLSQTPEGCSSFTLPLTVGLPSANELLYGGRKITAMEAYQQGLVSQVFWPTLMMQEVIPRAQNMANCSAKALEATKLLIRSHHRTKMELTNETECNLLLERWTSSECQRAIEAYISNEKNFTF